MARSSAAAITPPLPNTAPVPMAAGGARTRDGSQVPMGIATLGSDCPESDPLVSSIAPFALAPAAPGTRTAGGAGLVPHPTLMGELDRVIAEAAYHGLARVTGLSRSHITGILKGRRNCTVHYAEAVAGALGVSTGELLAYSGAKRIAYLAGIAMSTKKPKFRKRRP